MDARPPSPLTEKQIECLNLVLRGYGSKEIGKALGISAHTVDARLKAAIRTLGVANRFEAARRAAQLHTDQTYQSLVYQSPDVGLPAISESLPSTETGGLEQEGSPALMVRDVRHSFEMPAAEHQPTFPLPLPTRGRTRNDLSILVRLGWILVIMALLALGTGALLSSIISLGALMTKI